MRSSWSPLIADLCAPRRTRCAMLLRDGGCWTSADSPCFVLRPRRRHERLLSADCHRATSVRGRLQCVSLALLLVLCSLQPACAASELEDITKLADLALRRYEPSFKRSGNVSETLVSLLNSLRSSRLSHRFEAVNCSPPFNGSALCKEGAECLSVGDLLQLFPEAAESSVGEALVRLCPVLLFQMQHRSCDFTPPLAPRGKTRPTPAQVWGFGMLAVFVISCCSLAGLVIVPFLSHALYHRLLMVFEGLAVGSLLGSAVFHLIPQCTLDKRMRRPRVVRSAAEQAAFDKKRRQCCREQARARCADPVLKAAQAQAPLQRLAVDSGLKALLTEAQRQRRAANPEAGKRDTQF
ncbi:uncharacterized protein LOC119432405 [Dermacentor silvarum]|uniref:uncharacterized protein LOC119432405 n=1 Tax=Dermacentor silvarum TaxID=543639 RepID=UPI002101328A|nr:uncharacterized protein LOC119432405 [Dermacentor silvarum]